MRRFVLYLIFKSDAFLHSNFDASVGRPLLSRILLYTWVLISFSPNLNLPINGSIAFRAQYSDDFLISILTPKVNNLAAVAGHEWIHTSRKLSTACNAPAPPPTINTPFPGSVTPSYWSFAGRDLFSFNAFVGFPVTSILPSWTEAEKEWMESRAGASSGLKW